MYSFSQPLAEAHMECWIGWTWRFSLPWIWLFSAGFALLVLCLLSFWREGCSLQALGAGCRHWGIPDAGTSSQVCFLLSGQTGRSSDWPVGRCRFHTLQSYGPVWIPAVSAPALCFRLWPLCVCGPSFCTEHDWPSISPIGCSVAWLDQSQMQEESLNGPPSSTVHVQTLMLCICCKTRLRNGFLPQAWR